MSAYNELYVKDAACCLGEYFEYMVIDLHYDIDQAFEWFAGSAVGKEFELGHPKYVAGMSGVELAQRIVLETTRTSEDKAASSIRPHGKEYWVGQVIAGYQWSRDVSFRSMELAGFKASAMLRRYILHSGPIEKAYDEIDEMIFADQLPSSMLLRKLRKKHGLTQKELAEKSGVALRMIQLYEQGQNDMTKASVDSMLRLSEALNCSVEELIIVE